MWCGVVWCGVVWCGEVRCGGVSFNRILSPFSLFLAVALHIPKSEL